MLEPQEVRVFKSLNGIDYIGRVKEETDTYYLLEDVFAAQVYQDQQGGIGLNLGAIVHPILGKVDKKKNGATSELRLNKIGVVFDYAPEEQLETEYCKAATGIEITRIMPTGKL